jgi:hypothetical protein
MLAIVIESEVVSELLFLEELSCGCLSKRASWLTADIDDSLSLFVFVLRDLVPTIERGLSARRDNRARTSGSHAHGKLWGWERVVASRHYTYTVDDEAFL